jgi:hypothetical protein
MNGFAHCLAYLDPQTSRHQEPAPYLNGILQCMGSHFPPESGMCFAFHDSIHHADRLKPVSADQEFDSRHSLTHAATASK